MKIQILETIEGARKAQGLTVIIDVFRAFSLEAYLFARGAERIYAVGQKETALAFREKHPDYILIGERGGKILPGFDYGNSPSQTEKQDFSGRTVVHTTSAGTQGIVNASGADEIITGSLVNARADAEYIRSQQPEVVSLVAMGLGGRESAPEDLLCARYIRGILTGEELDMEKELAQLRRSPTVDRFFDPKMKEIFPEADYRLCTIPDRFPFVLGVKKAGDDVYLVTKMTKE